MTDQQDYVILFEAPKIVPPEFRLYYDDAGKVVCYTCEKLPGNFIVIDNSTFAQARPDVRVIDGKISTVQSYAVVSKLMPAQEGTLCTSEDISIVVDSSYDGRTQNWKLTTYEL
jgi:hypothetical protein